MSSKLPVIARPDYSLVKVLAAATIPSPPSRAIVAAYRLRLLSQSHGQAFFRRGKIGVDAPRLAEMGYRLSSFPCAARIRPRL